MVPGAQNKAMTVPWLVNRFKTSQPSAAATVVRLGLGDPFLIGFFTPYVTDAATHPLGVVFQALIDRVEKEATRADFQAEYICAGIEVQIISAAPVFQPGLDLKNLPAGNKSGIDTKWMSIDAKIAVRGDPAQVSLWEIGFTQTVMRLDRTMVFRDSNGTDVHLRYWIPTATKDGPCGYDQAWFDPQCKKPLDAQGFQTVNVWIKDRPGTSWTLPAGHTLLRIDGGEAFRTWLILRKTDGSATHFLRMWEWHVDYTIEPQNIPRFGVRFDGLQLFAASSVGAVLDGRNAKDIMRHEARKEHKLVTTFDEMKTWK
jgi:hypothetical protein